MLERPRLSKLRLSTSGWRRCGYLGLCQRRMCRCWIGGIASSLGFLSRERRRTPSAKVSETSPTGREVTAAPPNYREPAHLA